MSVFKNKNFVIYFLLIITIIFISILLLIFISVKFQKQSQTDIIQDQNCQNISESDAIGIVQELPEVKRYLSYFSDETRVAHPSKEPKIIIDAETEETLTIRVHEIDISGQPSIGTTFNTYTIDKCTGEVICSFTIYDEQGEWVRVSEVDECGGYGDEI